MTSRVRTVDRARSVRDPNRRTLYTNIGFAVVIVLALLILVGVGVTTWYTQHLAPAATVGGQTITKDQFLERAKVEQFRLQQQASRVNAEVSAGRLTAAQGKSRIDSINQRLDDTQGAFSSAIIEKLIDTRIQATLAGQIGVTVTPEQVDARILEDKTRKEERHVWVIAVKPQVDTGKTAPTAVQQAEAKRKAQDALAAIKGGKPFEEVAKTTSTDASAATGGDAGWIDDTSAGGSDWEAAALKLDVNGVTDVITGDDGTYRIARVSEIVPPEVDAAWDQKLADLKIPQQAYRDAITSEVLRTALGDKVIEMANASQAERKVQELYLKAASPAPGADAVKVRHILYSPKDSPDDAATIAADDPEWTKAQLGAQAAYDKLKADPSQFDAIARAESDESSAKGPDGTGGKLPPVDSASAFIKEFKDAVLKPDLQPGQILPPFKTEFGWHVVQIMYRGADSAEIAKLRDQAIAGTDFAQLVRDYSDGPKQTAAGDLGWVRLGTLDDRLTSVILATPKGQYTTVIDAKDDGLYFFKVIDERNAAPDKDEAATIKSDAFTNWYTGKKAEVKITRDLLGT
jgi:parvulin-like peptidyl-prolyl isomerase